MVKIGTLKLYIVIAIIGAVFLPPFVKYQSLLYKKRKLEERIRTLKAENARLENEKRHLQTDLVYIEKKARQKIGLVRKGEIVLKEAPKKK